MKNMKRRKYDVRIDGIKIRSTADFDRIDMSKSERRWKHRKMKLEKRAEASMRAGEAEK